MVRPMRTFVLTVIGPDTPGLVERLAAAISAAGGLWIDSRMSQLAGQFAGILRVQVEDEQADTLRAGLLACETETLRLVIHEGQEAAPVERRLVGLELVGGDRAGIVHEISRVIASRNVNVVRLETEITGAPWSGESLFKALATLEVPPGLELVKLREALEAIATDLMVTIQLEER